MVAKQYAAEPDAPSVETLLKRYQRLTKKYPELKTKTDSRNTLSKEQEDALAHSLAAFSQCHLGLSCQAIQNLVKDNFSCTISKSWITRFLKRNGMFSLLKMKKLSVARSGEIISKLTNHFIVEHTKFLDEHKMWNSPSRIFNFDESRVGAYQGKTCYRKTLYLKGSGQSSQKCNRAVQTTSVLPVVSADGKVLVVYYILPASFKEEAYEGTAKFSILNYTPATRQHYPEMFAFTETGFVNQSLFKVIMHDIQKRIATRLGDVETLFLLDNCAIHKDIDLILSLADKRLFLNFLPPNTTHFLQPLDAYFFGRFKAQVYGEIEEIQTADMILGGKINPCTTDVAQSAMKKISTANIIQASFKTTGIFPFSKEIILKNMQNTKMNYFSESGKLSVQCCKSVIIRAKKKKKVREETTVVGSATIKRDYLYTAKDFKAFKELQDKANKEKADIMQKRAETTARKFEQAQNYFKSLTFEITEENLKSLTIPNIKLICRAKGLTKYSTLNKKSLVELVVTHVNKHKRTAATENINKSPQKRKKIC